MQKNIFEIIEVCNKNSDHILKDFNLNKNGIMQILCDVINNNNKKKKLKVLKIIIRSLIIDVISLTNLSRK